MIKKIDTILLVALAGLALISCAKEKEESAREIQQRILDAYVEVNCPTAQKLESGIVLLSCEDGRGDTLDKYESAYMEVTTRSLAGNYAETTDEELAKRLGRYSAAEYYGPSLYAFGIGRVYTGIEELLIGRQTGTKVEFILPPWLTTMGGSDSWGSAASSIYTMEITRIIRDMAKFQADSMRAYANIHYPGLDTLSKGFYYKKLAGINGDSTKNKSVRVEYVGRLLDGFVFDTNIKDTARKYDIFSPTKDYHPMDVRVGEDLNNMMEESSLVKGFCKALMQMHYGDTGFTMFESEMGYGAKGSGEIGPQQPLIFWLHILPE